MSGPQEAPQGDSRSVELAPAIAGTLAYYQAEGVHGVLAPRGWSCHEIYGSGGAVLMVGPHISERTEPNNIQGPAVVLTYVLGTFSGRFQVAQYVARAFPKIAAPMIKDRIDEDLGMKRSDFPLGPYPHDRMVSRGANLIEYETPAYRYGLGTSSAFGKSADPVDGLVRFEEANDASISLLQIRLPKQLRHLKKAIISEFERDPSKH